MAEAAHHPVCDIRLASKGPRFFHGEDGGVLFEIQLDSRARIGPRPATEEDSLAHPAAWQAFAAGGEAAAAPPAPQIQAIEVPGAKAAEDARKAERQRRMDAKRGGGL